MEPITVAQLVPVLAQRGAASRSLTAIAGAPGAGKSTLAEALTAALNAEEPGSAALIPMDGFHFDDAVLIARGHRDRKGAPHTFDVDGFASLLSRLRADDGSDIAVPVFDRTMELSRNAARIVPATARHLIVEGNYLLLDQPPWAALAPLFDSTVFLSVPMAVIEQRLMRRWEQLGPEQARAKLEQNDLPNARLVVAESRTAEFALKEESSGP